MSAQSRRRALRAVAPVAGLLAAGLLVWQGSSAAFTATTDTAANNWTAGSVELRNNSNGGATFNLTGAAAFTVTGIKPGDSGSRCIAVRSTATSPVAGNARFYVTNTSGALLNGLNLAVDYQTVAAGTTAPQNADCSGFTSSGSVFSSAFNVAPTTYAGAGATGQWALTGVANENRVYRITWSFPSTGSDNTYQGTTASAVFNWTVQSS